MSIFDPIRVQGSGASAQQVNFGDMFAPATKVLAAEKLLEDREKDRLARKAIADRDFAIQKAREERLAEKFAMDKSVYDKELAEEQSARDFRLNPGRVQGAHRNIYDTAVEKAFDSDSKIGKEHAKILADKNLSQLEREEATGRLYTPKVDKYSKAFNELAPLREDVESNVYNELKQTMSPDKALAIAKIESNKFQDRATIGKMLESKAKARTAQNKTQVEGIKNVLDTLGKIDKNLNTGRKTSTGKSGGVDKLIDTLDLDNMFHSILPIEAESKEAKLIAEELKSAHGVSDKNIKTALLSSYNKGGDVDLDEFKSGALKLNKAGTDGGKGARSNLLGKYVKNTSQNLQSLLTPTTARVPSVDEYLAQRQKQALAGIGVDTPTSSARGVKAPPKPGGTGTKASYAAKQAQTEFDRPITSSNASTVATTPEKVRIEDSQYGGSGRAVRDFGRGVADFFSSPFKTVNEPYIVTRPSDARAVVKEKADDIVKAIDGAKASKGKNIPASSAIIGNKSYGDSVIENLENLGLNRTEMEAIASNPKIPLAYRQAVAKALGLR